MLLLQANHIHKSYGTKTVLDFDQLLIYEGDKIGVVGENGSGKSTLLGILSREIAPDQGEVVGDWQVDFIHQFSQLDPNRSGGENAKRTIRETANRPDQILFADEPTANLDLDGQKWVLQKLRSAGTLVLVSHDRALLDQVCTKIIALKDGSLKEYPGNYSDYETAVRLEAAQHQQAYDDYRKKKAQLEDAVQAKQKDIAGLRQSKKSEYRKNLSEARLRGDKRAAKFKKAERQSTVLEHRLERLPAVEKLREPPALRMDFSLTQPPGNKHVITCKNLCFSYGTKSVFRDASFVVPNRAKVAITGKNGAGKTTLLKLIAQGHESIATVPKLRCGYLHQNFENLDVERTVLDNVLLTSVQDMASVRSILAGLLFFGDDVYKSVSVLSGGEKMRLSLAKLLASSSNALLLDEPTNYLDLRSVEAVRDMIRQYPGTVLLVCHDSRFVEEVASLQLQIDSGTVKQLPVQIGQASAASPAQKTLLELRLTQLVSQISSAPPAEKDKLEAQYHETLQQLRECS